MRKKFILSLLILNCFLFTACSSNNIENNVSTESKQETVTDITPQKNVESSTPKVVEKKKEPTVGMRESEIEDTKLGKATDIEKCRDFNMLDDTHKWKKYTWDFGNGKKMVATVYYDDGYGKVHSIEKYPKDPYGNTMSGYWD